MNQEFEKLGKRREKEDLERAKRISPEERVEESSLSEKERILKENLRREIEKMEVTPGMEKEAEKQAERIESLGAEKKIGSLLESAEEKGLSYAVEVARKTKDPFLLDLFHDTLARNQLYKKFKKE